MTEYASLVNLVYLLSFKRERKTDFKVLIVLIFNIMPLENEVGLYV